MYRIRNNLILRNIWMKWEIRLEICIEWRRHFGQMGPLSGNVLQSGYIDSVDART